MKPERRPHVRLLLILLAVIAANVIVYVAAVNLFDDPFIVGAVVAAASSVTLLVQYALVLRTLKDINAAASRMVELDFSRKCREPLTKEFTDLAATVNRLSESLEANVANLHESNRQLSQEESLPRQQR